MKETQEITQQSKSDEILTWTKQQIESKKMLNPELWLEIAFRLNLLLGDDHLDLENLRSIVANKKLKLLREQEGKKNVAAVEIEIEASDEYRVMKIQEHKVSRVEEFIRLAKKNANQY